MTKYRTVRLETEKGVATVTLVRPEIHNAFDDVMLAELTEIFGKLGGEEDVRVAVVAGEGKSFCAGADLKWMKRMVDYSYEENMADSIRLAECMHSLFTLPKPTIARVNGATIGGGMGLLAACDIAVASEKAVFGLSEVKLGLAPAVISPYVIRRIGESKGRELFLTGDRIDAKRALAIGLVHRVVPHDKIDETVADIVMKLMTGGPEALAASKVLLERVPGMPLDRAKEFTADLIARLRIGEEGQEGMNAFLEKRPAAWRQS